MKITEKEVTELSEFLAQKELEKPSSVLAAEIFKTRGKDYCAGLTIILGKNSTTSKVVR